MAGERIVIGLSGGLEGEILIRRAVKVLDAAGAGDLLAVHIRSAEGASGESTSALESQRRLVVELGGSYHTVAADDPVEALLGFASHVGATRLVIGQSRAWRASPRDTLAGWAGLGGRVGLMARARTGEIALPRGRGET